MTDTVPDKNPEKKPRSFHELGIAPEILKVLDRLKFVVPTPIQDQSIPIAIEGSDVIGIAQTGTGKTLAFGIPLVQHLLESRARALVLAPTRELAMQIDDVICQLTGKFKMETVVLIGGASMGKQIQKLNKKPQILIATPGRLIDHMQQRNVDISGADYVVLDEADRMLDMGFMPQIRIILKKLPQKRQTMLFSATMPTEILSIARSYMNEPVRVEIAKSGTAAEGVVQELYIVKSTKKRELVKELVKKYKGTILIFTNTKIATRQVGRYLRESGFPAAEIHSDLGQGQRVKSLEGFKDGAHRVLVATDIAARGIDVIDIELVINYDLPDDPENYVHRIGRTGRAGKDGLAISIATPDQKSDVKLIEKLMNTTIAIAQHPNVPAESFPQPVKPLKARRRSFGSGRR